MTQLSILMAVWIIGYLVLFGLTILIFAGLAAFGRDRTYPGISLPFTITTGIYGPKILMVPVLMAYLGSPLAILVYSKLHRINPFFFGCLGFFALMSVVVILVTFKPTRICFERNSINVTRLSVITGQALDEDGQKVSVSALDRVTLRPGGGKRSGRTVSIGIGDGANAEKISFLVPERFSAKSLAQELGRVYGRPVYVASAFSTKKLG